MITNRDRTTSVRVDRLLRILPLIALLLVLWQIPFVGMVHRLVGTRVFLLAAYHQGSISSANSGSLVSTKIEAEALKAAVFHLQQANLRLNTDRTLGVVALATNDLADARTKLQRQLDTVPNDVIARFFLGEVYHRLGDTDAAIQQWTAVGAKASLIDLAENLASSDETQAQALDVFNTVMRLDETDVTSRWLAAKLWTKEGHPEHALVLAQELITVAPQKPDGYVISGNVMFEEEEYEQAISFFEKALQRNPADSRWILVRLGQSYANRGYWSKAIEAYGQAIREDPSHHWDYALMGEAHCQLGHSTEALSYYEQAIALGNQSGRTHKMTQYIAKYESCPP